MHPCTPYFHGETEPFGPPFVPTIMPPPPSPVQARKSNGYDWTDHSEKVSLPVDPHAAQTLMARLDISRSSSESACE